MQQLSKPVSKLKVVLLWLLLVGNLIFWTGFIVWRHRNDTASPAGDPGDDLLRAVVMLGLGTFFLAAGVGSHLAVLFTNCFTFNFNRPVFSEFKGKLYLAKIIVPTLASIGAGLILSVFLSPLLRALGMQGELTFLLPVFAVLIPMQIAQMWVLIWAPLTRRMITKRLLVQGITAAQLQTATLLGISNPLRSSFKKLTLVEDDVGALWIAPDRLVYYGDTEQFAVTPEQLVQLERRADAGSTTMLSGIAHVILHVQLPAGNERQIRLHTAGHWTLGRHRKAMDELAAAIAQWHARAAPIAPAR